MRKVLFAGLILLSGVSVFGQSISAKKDIAVFRLSHSSWEVPTNALAQVDQQIEDVFVNLGSFTVIGMDHRLAEDDIAQFVQALKERLQASTAIPEDFSLGKETFTKTELDRLAGSFLIVVPVLTSYSLQHAQRSGYTAELGTAFTFISGEESSSIAHVAIRTVGVGSTPVAAVRDAAASISQQLVYKVRGIPEFQLKIEVIEVTGNTVLIDFGRNKGVKVGDEYAFVTSRVLSSGRIVSDRTGLIVVKEVKEEISFARVIYSKTPPQIGDQLREVARVGLKSSVYFHVTAANGVFGTTYAPVYTVGTLHTITRGLYNLRPVIGLEVPLAGTTIGGSASYGSKGLPLNIYLGAELNWRLWRFDIVPLAAVGIGGSVPLSSQGSYFVSVAGGIVQVRVSYLATPALTMFVDLGFEQWLPISHLGWGGFYGGVGIALNY